MTDCTGERRDAHDGTRTGGGTDDGASAGTTADVDAGVERTADRDAASRSSDWRATGDLCLAIVAAVADVTGREPTTVPPLYPTVDVDALGRLLRDARGSEVRVTFDYAGCAVAVSSDGDLAVEPSD
jgi:hypothetical protein